MPGFSSDLLQASRSLLRSPAFLLTAVITLALGLGANAAMFSATYALLLRPLPYQEPDRLVSLYETVRKDGSRLPVSLLDLADWREQGHSFSGLAAYRPRSFGIQRAGNPEVEVVQVGMVTADFFRVLGVQPVVGRTFTAEEESQELPVVVLSHRLWTRSFGGDPKLAAGGKVLLNEEPYTALGVLPEGFAFPMRGELPEAWIPLSHADYGTTRNIRSLDAVARLREGVTPDQARRELRELADRSARANPDTNALFSADLESLHEALRGQNRRPLTLLTGAGLLLFLIACTNVVNLLLAHFLARSQATAIRAALGAKPAQIVRHFLAHGVVLTVLGAAAGLVTARLCVSLLPMILPLLGGAAPPAGLEAGPLRLDGAVLLFTLGLSLFVTLLLVLASVSLARRTDLNGLLKEGNEARGGTRSRLRHALVVGQIAFSTMLLLTAGLLLRSFAELLSADPGFRTEQVYKFGLGLPESRYGTDEKMIGFHQELVRRLEAVPGVQAAGAIAGLPLAGPAQAFGTSIQPEGVELPRDQRPVVVLAVASPGYFRALSIPLLKGRGFQATDTVETPRVLLVNQTLERRLYPNKGALGRRITIGWRSDLNPGETPWEIVGVVGDTRQASLEEPVEPAIYLPMSQFPVDGCSYTVKSARTDAAFAQALRDTVRGQDGQLETIEVRTMTEVVRESLGDRRLLLLLTALFSGIALLLTAVGIYGVTAFNMTQRDHEMALRLTLGAQARQIIQLVLGEGLRLAVAGILLGLAAFYFAKGLLASQLYNVASMDPLTLAAVAAVLCLIAILACAVPSIRVSRTSPMRVIRR